MKGWCGKILRVDLTRTKHVIQALDEKLARDYLGGRGFAAKMLWDEVGPDVGPYDPENLFIVAAGPLTGLLLPSSGKLVVAAKSPLTGGYGDGNIGTKAAVQLRKAGYDMLILKGRAEKPTVLVVDDESVSFKDAGDLWGSKTYHAQEVLEEEYGKDAGILLTGPSGEKLVRFAVIVSDYGRAGGRPGLGAVLGSKNVKAIVFKGSGEIPVADEEIADMGKQGYEEVRNAKGYDFWIRQGTMMTVEWAQGNSVLPTWNFTEGVFDQADGISGKTMEEQFKVLRKGCPNCNMQCGNVCEIREGPLKGGKTELDYENAGMLGSNIGIGDMNWVLTLNLLADEMGADTISLGSVMAFITEAYIKGLVSEDKIGIKPRWGDGEAYYRLAEMICNRQGYGDVLAEGVRRVALGLGRGSMAYAMHVKGLEISAYDCHAAPGMALAYGTSPIGAHHKDAWYIAWELKLGREVISREKVEGVIRMQRIRGGLFESAVTCRLPWIELNFNLEWYPKYLKAATGLEFTLEDLWKISDRIYSLIRSYWIREYPDWSREMDYPPEKWFTQPLSKGPLKGWTLKSSDYDQLLTWYYEARGWDRNGIPKISTLKSLGLEYVIDKLKDRGVKLEE